MIRGVNNQVHIPYVLEDDRGNSAGTQTVFHIRAKTGEDNNKTLRRYSSTYKEGRKGTRDVDDRKLNAADVDEFLSICSKVENYGFPEGHKLYDPEKDPVKLIDTKDELIEVARTLSADHLAEVFEVANNIAKLSEGAKKNSNS